LDEISIDLKSVEAIQKSFILAVTPFGCYFFCVSTITAKYLHQETKTVLNQLEKGETLVITRNGRTIGRIEPLTVPKSRGWADIMDEVWRAQKTVKAADRMTNPVLQERKRRRR
jgi:antitoxin (DNA-binding transcriptional repressor) of toxin-antitoxin stability system